MRWIFIAGGILLLVMIFLPRSSGVPEIGITRVMEMAKAGQLTNIVVREDKLNVTTTRGDTFESRKEGSVSVLELLQQQGVETGVDGIQIEVKKKGSSFGGVLLTLLPLIVFGGLIFWMLRRSRGGINQAMSIGKTQAQVSLVDKPSVTFDDVAGVEEAKQELAEIVEFLRYPEKFAKLGAKIPRGVLLAGPPGTGPLLAGRLPEKQRYPSSPSAAANSWRCSWVWGQAVYGTSSARPNRAPPPSSSSMR